MKKVEKELKKYEDDSKAARQATDGRTLNELKERNEALEKDNSKLKLLQQTVVAYNKDHGTMEYIGEPVPLEYKDK